MLKRFFFKISSESKSFQWKTIRESSYRVLVIPGHTQVEEEKKEMKKISRKKIEPRYKLLGDGREWVDVWPTAKSFNYSVSPLPVRMGFIEGTENGGVIPSKYGNAELMKLPNFLHLTPAHIKKHCQKLKKYCTEWPKDLKEDSLMEMSHFDYLRDGPSVKDERARFVSVTVKISRLHLPKVAKEKFLRLTSRFCVRHQDTLIITSGKCPTKQQNYDYIRFLLSVLYKESLKREEWEDEMEVEDMLQYKWTVNKSYRNMKDLLHLLQAGKGAASETATENGEGDKKEEAKATVKSAQAGVVDEKVMLNYGKSVEKLLNHQETLASVSNYKKNVHFLFQSIANR